MPITQDLLEDIDLLLEALARPALVLHRPYPLNDVPVGLSRFGGLPTLPAGFDWPVGWYWPFEGPPGPRIAPLTFVAQIDCTDVHRYDGRFPDHGVLFFFASLAGEQLINEPTPDGSVGYAVIYAPDVDPKQPERSLPEGAPPVFRSSSFSFTLPEEPRLASYPRAPMIIRRFTSYPQLGSIAPNGCATAALELAWPKGDVPRSLLSAPYEEFRAAYFHRHGWLTAASLMRSVEWMYQVHDYAEPSPEPDCPAHIHYVVRTIINAAAGVYFGHRPDPQLEESAREWLTRKASIFSDQILSVSLKREFTSWLNSVSDLDRNRSFRIYECVQAGMNAAALRGYGPMKSFPNRVNGARPQMFSVQRNQIGLPNYRQSMHCQAHQIGGWFPSCQTPRPAADTAIGLLHLMSDYGLEYMFWDCGELQFWIEPEDLLAKRFDRAWATIDGG